MWIVFGWSKEERPVAEVTNAYCYDCRRKTLWIMWNDSEWVTFSAIRTLRFVNNRLHCASCTFFLDLGAAEVGAIKRYLKTQASIDGTPLHASFVQRIESSQLAGKTPKQLKFIRESMDAEREYAERMKETAEREVQGDALPLPAAAFQWDSAIRSALRATPATCFRSRPVTAATLLRASRTAASTQGRTCWVS